MGISNSIVAQLLPQRASLRSLVLSQFQPCKLVGHPQRLLQAPGVLARGLGRHVLAASFAVQQGAQLLNPLAGLQAPVGHILKERRVFFILI